MVQSPASSLHFSPSVLTPQGASPLASQTTRGAEGKCLTLEEKLKGLLLGKGVDHDALILEHYFQMDVRYFLKQFDFSISPSRQYTALGKARRDMSIPSLRPAVQRGSHRGSPSFAGSKEASRHSIPVTRKDHQILLLNRLPTATVKKHKGKVRFSLLGLNCVF